MRHVKVAVAIQIGINQDGEAAHNSGIVGIQDHFEDTAVTQGNIAIVVGSVNKNALKLTGGAIDLKLL